MSEVKEIQEIVHYRFNMFYTTKLKIVEKIKCGYELED